MIPLSPLKALEETHAKLFLQSVADRGAEHDDDCPGDDTCGCSEKPLNEAVNAVCYAIEKELPYLRAVRETVEQEMADLRAQLAARDQEMKRLRVERDVAINYGAGMKKQKEAAEAEVERLRSFVSELAGIQTCDDDKAHCTLDSGPYCGRHDFFIEDRVIEARKLLAALTPSAPETIGYGE